MRVGELAALPGMGDSNMSSPFPPSKFILPNNLSRLTSSVGAPVVAQGRIQTSQGNLLSDCGRLGSRARRGVAFQGLILLLYFALNWLMSACSLELGSRGGHLDPTLLCLLYSDRREKAMHTSRRMVTKISSA